MGIAQPTHQSNATSVARWTSICPEVEFREDQVEFDLLDLKEGLLHSFGYLYVIAKML
jgi:hypothetical protein